MKYVKADLVFPEELLIEIQKYVQGGLVYIPKPNGTRTKWGENSGSRTYLRLRNEEIRLQYANGTSIDELSDRYSLSYDSIRRIIYSNK
ncbi:CD3324 family protein [Paenibacillus guangzhouensis]|uniref:CD3324 family protein n=1 Tax=Paenibacillus guangzhouensis TaxID=1473112 RepID=UPI0012673614|nr:CD3324 family protein [Paenibacillus guangzhouensis]